MHQNTIFIAINAVHVSGFTSPSSGAQETCIRFERVGGITVLLKGERGIGKYLSANYVPCMGSEISFPGLESIWFGWYPGRRGCVYRCVMVGSYDGRWWGVGVARYIPGGGWAFKCCNV
jgi:hypothetical protein